MKKFVVILCLIGVIAVIVGIKVAQIRKLMATKQVIPVMTVSTTEATAENWQQTLTAVGSLSAVQGVTVAAELDGRITEIDFQAGQSVTAGDVLVRQDTSAEEAQLRSAEASLELMRVNLKRTKELLEKATVSQAQYDSDFAGSKQASAGADNIRATIAKKTIKAPFTGRLGIRLVNLGQNLKAGDPIVSLQALDPIFIDFYIPQEQIGQLALGLSVRISGDGIPKGTGEGKVTAISPDIDATTRNVRVQATIANKDHKLRPGMYVDVAVELPVVNKIVAIPATAVLYAPYGDNVYVVEEQIDKETGKKVFMARQQIVRLGARRGDFVEVTSGLKAGQTIVSSGVFQLQGNGPVNVNNTLAPDAQLAPTPADT
ncbi:MAG TPA: efflux RND transporter periplasmic adaptor subunit [Opitutaceae bacterium]|jgi:membrane fusion protein (multidrug efflux system)